MVSVLLILLAAPLLLYLPGWSLGRALHESSADLLERHYERVVISALWSGWLSLLLAEIGAFSLWLHLAITLAASVGLWMRGVRSRESGVGLPTPDSRLPTPDSRLPLELLGFIVIGLISLFLAAQPFQVLLGVRDAGVYANTGLAIARTGSLVQTDPLLAEIGRDAESTDPTVAEPAKQAISNFLIGQPRVRYIATRLRAAGFLIYEGDLDIGKVVPQGLHLLPAWIALLAAVGGPQLGLFAPGLLAVLGAWGVGMLGRRLAGPGVGMLAFLFLSLNGVQVWFARYSTAETAAQFLIWAGLYFFAKMQMDDGESGVGSRESGVGSRESGVRSRARAGRGPGAGAGGHVGPFLPAIMVGVAIGQVALARLDFFLLGPVLAYLLYCWVSRRWGRPQTLMALGMGAMLLHAGLHIALIARAYLFDTGHDRLMDSAIISLLSLPFLTDTLRADYLAHSALARPGRLALELIALALAVGGLLALRWRSNLLHRAEGYLIARRTLLIRLVMAGVLLLAGYAYLVRPQIIDADLLFNTRGGWSDPLTRDPALVAGDVRSGRLTPDEAHTMAGVVMQPGPYWFSQPDLAATKEQRARLAAERGPWQGPFSNQTSNWLRLQGYIGAPIHLPVILWYNEFKPMSWWQRLMTDPSTLTSAPAPLQNKETIPLANMVRVGWYLSPLGIILGVAGYVLWWRRGFGRASWLFLTISFIGTYYFVRQTYGTSDQTYIYILRRFVPIAYPALSLGMAYALAALAQNAKLKMQTAKLLGIALYSAAFAFCILQLAFFIVTNQPIYRHVEYAGALGQLDAAAAKFTPGRDVLLMRGGAPIWSDARDIPDLVATPLRFTYGLDAFTVKSSQPGAYADALAAEVARWQSQGREVYLLLSASGASFALPGFRLDPAGGFALDIPEFEQLTSQKPRNVARLTLPFQIYRALPSTPGVLDTARLPLTPDDFVAQVGGFYRPESRADGSRYAWTNGDALLRLAWQADAAPQTLRLTLAAGERPAHLGPARVCLSAQPEDGVWPQVSDAAVDLGCQEVAGDLAEYTVHLDPAALPPAPGGTLLLRITSEAWVPAAEDSQQTDQRSVGVQFGGITADNP
ncbi:hypothetical protein EKD04_007550 [Chloroflexales bacterium ZM16-3]|nr:hypothetical protein [Chloroflexales bacterium ZM16-3]